MAEDKTILVGLETKKIMDNIIEKQNPGSFLNILKSAVQSKNKQAHRLSGDTKRGRQFLAQHTKPLGTVTTRETNAREAGQHLKHTINGIKPLTNSRPDVIFFDDIESPNSKGDLGTDK